MLTTPARSDHRPPSPASMIGVVATRVAAMVPDDVGSLASVTFSSTARNSSAAGSAAIRAQVGIRRVFGGGAATGGLAGGGGVVLRGPPPARRARGPKALPPPAPPGRPPT